MGVSLQDGNLYSSLVDSFIAVYKAAHIMLCRLVISVFIFIFFDSDNVLLDNEIK